MSSSRNAVQSVTEFDLARYLGLWFEIGRLPLRFEDDGARDVTAHYSLNDDGTVRVDNRCIDASGDAVQAEGKAEADPDHAGRLRVTFLPAALQWIPFTEADYWVLRIDSNYQHALVGTPDNKHLWLLSREPSMPAELEQSFLSTARMQGYNLDHWIRPEQSGSTVEIA
ncbi:lipocalin family protein [Microbacterium sp. YY-01]|uniref:lipocalin family protein n=1 Tax=Microbacterium sp. YY-01 TaxID=3421634 RepID=UPI003D17957E